MAPSADTLLITTLASCTRGKLLDWRVSSAPRLTIFPMKGSQTPRLIDDVRMTLTGYNESINQIQT